MVLLVPGQETKFNPSFIVRVAVLLPNYLDGKGSVSRKFLVHISASPPPLLFCKVRVCGGVKCPSHRSLTVKGTYTKTIGVELLVYRKNPQEWGGKIRFRKKQRKKTRTEGK